MCRHIQSNQLTFLTFDSDLGNFLEFIELKQPPSARKPTVLAQKNIVYFYDTSGLIFDAISGIWLARLPIFPAFFPSFCLSCERITHSVQVCINFYGLIKMLFFFNVAQVAHILQYLHVPHAIYSWKTLKRVDSDLNILYKTTAFMLPALKAASKIMKKYYALQVWLKPICKPCEK